MQKLLLYMSYGKDCYHLETMFSILSARYFSNKTQDYRIIVYTDRPLEYAWLGVDVCELTPTTMQRWLGEEGGYPFRRKIACILEVIERGGCKVAFLDGDTFFRKDPSNLFDRISIGRSCLHLSEIRLTNRSGTAGALLKELLDRNLVQDTFGHQIVFHPREMMWNSGVIGVDSSDVRKIRESLRLVDEMWKYERGVHTLEQFALGHIMADEVINSTDDVVFHYWHNKNRNIFLTKLPGIIKYAQQMPLRDAAEWAYRQRPISSQISKTLGGLRDTMHRFGFNHRWTRTSY